MKKRKAERHLIERNISSYKLHLYEMERSEATIEKYMHDVKLFAKWADGKVVTRDVVIEWKQSLIASKLSAVTVNTKLAAVNGLFSFLGWVDCRVQYLKVQRKLFRPSEKDLSYDEYKRLVEAAERIGDIRLALLLEAICSTGIRVSELKYITVEACNAGRTDISLKGKVRVIIITNKMADKLLKYAKEQKIASGEIFLTKSGKSMDRREIWAQMKHICKQADVDAKKVFPHNLRHLFATCYYNAKGDVVKLADMLGHTSMETTRIYLLGSGDEHRREIEELGLVS